MTTNSKRKTPDKSPAVEADTVGGQCDKPSAVPVSERRCARSKFLISKASPARQIPSQRTHAPAGRIIPRAAEITKMIRRFPSKQFKKTAPRAATTKRAAKPMVARASQVSGGAESCQRRSSTPRFTIMECFRRQQAAGSLSDEAPQPLESLGARASTSTSAQPPSAPDGGGLQRVGTSSNAGGQPDAVGAAAAWYAGEIGKEVMSGRRDLRGSPWVLPDDVGGEGLTGEVDAAYRPRVFVWAPEKLLPGWRLPCPICLQHTFPAECHAPRVVHTLTDHYMYVCTKHVCSKCLSSRGELAQRPRMKVSADRPEVLASVPASVRKFWNIVTTGRTLFDVEVLDHVRAMSTRTSWAAVADGINETKSLGWARFVVRTQLALPEHLPSCFQVCDNWLRNLYASDAAKRQRTVTQELEANLGTDIILMDWTCKAAARCGSPYLFNVMSGDQTILVSKLTRSNGPREIEPEIARLKDRGVEPRVAYVDDHCCGAWLPLLKRFWPHVCVRLDVMHAIQRLAQTTISTQHPWHGPFCKSLSNAIYTYDPIEQTRLQQAWERAGHGPAVPDDVQKQYVPRTIINPSRIVTAIKEIINEYAKKRHAVAGELLTAETYPAWERLQKHVAAGCLCDPPGIDFNWYGKVVSVGGEQFWTVTSSRGISPLEGFHAHQKEWLGHRATHATDVGEALLRDGAVRWNRKRRGGTPFESRCVEEVCDHVLLNALDG